MKEKTWNGSALGRFRMLPILFNDWKKQCLTITFLLSLCSVVILMSLETFEIDINGTKEKYTLLEMMVHGKDWICSNTSFSWEELIMQQPGRQLIDFVTVIASLPFLLQFCNERKFGNLRANIFRTGRWRYYTSKIVSGMLSGGIIVGSGFFLFSAWLYLFFPRALQTGGDISFFLPEGFTADEFGKYLILCIIGMFFYGMAATIFGIVLSAVTKDIYICLTIPFLIKWINEIFRSYLYSYLYIENEEIKGAWLKFLDWWKNYGSFEQIIYEIQNQKFRAAGLAFAMLCMFGSVIFILGMNGRKDYGD